MAVHLDMTHVTLAVLAGGEGTRMGTPKQNLQIANQPILEYLSRRFTWPGPTLVVTAPGRERPPGADYFDAEVVDAFPKQGPLQGIFTAVEHAKTQWVIIVTVDMPELETQQLRYLIHRLIIQPARQGLMLQRHAGGTPGIEPFPFACRRDIAPMIETRLSEGHRSVRSLTELPGIAVEPAPQEWPPSAWVNLNSPEDYEAFKRLGQKIYQGSASK